MWNVQEACAQNFRPMLYHFTSIYHSKEMKWFNIIAYTLIHYFGKTKIQSR